MKNEKKSKTLISMLSGGFLLVFTVVMLGCQSGAARHSWMPEFNNPNGGTPRSATTVPESRHLNQQSNPGSEKKQYYSGYAEQCLPVRTLIRKGEWKNVSDSFKKSEQSIKKQTDGKREFAEEVGKLGLMELGTIFLLTGNLDRSIDRFSWAERLMDMERTEGGTTSALETSTSKMGEFFSGQREIEEYAPAGFEKVLMLNYESINYLLKGKRKSYNIARRAINWQQMEHKKFREEVEEAKEKQKARQKKREQAGKIDPSISVEKSINALMARHRDIATEVPNAFVNPFGYYVTGMINEFDSYKKQVRSRSLLDNARISYEKGLELTPESEVLQKAVKDLKDESGPPDGTRLVHIVAGSGFAPIKQTWEFSIRVQNKNIPYRLPVYTPVPTPVDSISVETTEGKELAELSTISNIGALALRYQQDRTPERIFDVTTSLIRNVIEKDFFQQLGVAGKKLEQAREKMKNPDTRSWCSLPKDLQAARLYLDKEVSTVHLVSRDGDGNVLAERSVDVHDRYPDFIYARAIAEQMKVDSPDELWLKYEN